MNLTKFDCLILQGLKHEAQQLQLQLQRVQQEEAETNPDVNLSAEQPRRSDQIRRRLVEIDHSIKQVSNRFE